MHPLSKTASILSSDTRTGHVSHHCLVDPAFIRNDISRRTELQTRECGTGKIDPGSDLLSVLAASNENKTDVLELVNILQWLIIKQDILELIIRDGC